MLLAVNKNVIPSAALLSALSQMENGGEILFFFMQQLFAAL
jgi:hypothetical protein